MKAWKKYIFLFFAYSIILLHTLVPHQLCRSQEGNQYKLQSVETGKTVDGWVEIMNPERLQGIFIHTGPLPYILPPSKVEPFFAGKTKEILPVIHIIITK